MADLRAFLRWCQNTNGIARSPFSLTTGDIQAYCSYCQEVKGYAPATINRRIQALRKFYDVAVAGGHAPANPAEDVSLLGEVASERSRSLSEEDVARLLTAVQEGGTRWAARDLVIIQMLLGAGLKLSELTELCLNDVRLEDGEPYILIHGDEGSPGRMIPLEAEVYDALCDYLPNRQAAPGVDRVCINRDGKPLSTRSVQRLLHTYARVAGLNGLTTQALRYVYARQLYERCGDLTTVARLLGHRHLATTIRYLRPSSPHGE